MAAGQLLALMTSKGIAAPLQAAQELRAKEKACLSGGK